ncbi:MAG TPA: CAP domain-containing protein [Candidatus Limnocylindria bacterium]
MTVQRSRTPRHAIARASGLAGVALAAAALLASNPAPATGWQQGAAEATLFQLMNGARVNNGRKAVQQHSTLVSLARWRSKDQVDRNYFDHTIAGTGYQVYHWYDLNGLKYSWGGENIGWNNGYSDADSPVAIHQGFMDSPGHRANILEPSFTHGGVGAYGKDNVNFLGKLRSPRFYTELFMAASSAPPPPPSGGGGGGGGGSPQPPPSGGGTAASPVRQHRNRPEAKPLHVDAPSAPRASSPMDGATVVAAAAGSTPTAAVRALAFVGDPSAPAGAMVARPSTSLRVESAAAPERGLFESMLGTLLGFVL